MLKYIQWLNSSSIYITIFLNAQTYRLCYFAIVRDIEFSIYTVDETGFSRFLATKKMKKIHTLHSTIIPNTSNSTCNCVIIVHDRSLEDSVTLNLVDWFRSRITFPLCHHLVQEYIQQNRKYHWTCPIEQVNT